jgi:hypothetical protein
LIVTEAASSDTPAAGDILLAPKESTEQPMGLGTSILLIAVGAILKYAVSWSIEGIDLQVVGTILLIIGILGLIISLVYMFVLNRQQTPADRTVVQDRYRDRP